MAEEKSRHEKRMDRVMSVFEAFKVRLEGRAYDTDQHTIASTLTLAYFTEQAGDDIERTLSTMGPS